MKQRACRSILIWFNGYAELDGNTGFSFIHFLAKQDASAITSTKIFHSGLFDSIKSECNDEKNKNHSRNEAPQKKNIRCATRANVYSALIIIFQDFLLKLTIYVNNGCAFDQLPCLIWMDWNAHVSSIVGIDRS